MKRAALYGRVSTEEQDEGMQIREMRERCQSRQWDAMEFIDHGISGGKENRPALDEMMKQVRRGKFEVVMVYKFDRFARSLRQLILALEEFDALGVAFVSLHDDVDTTTPSGRLMFHMIGAFAEFERACIRERVKSGLAHARANGKHLGRPRAFVDAAYIRKRRGQGTAWDVIARELKVSKETCRRALQNASKVA
jgi:DNA invertase Pin-like site-specific DNA recombinase